VLKGLPDHCVDAVVTDPPYALVSIVKRFGGEGAAPTRSDDAYGRASAGFMGRRWDTGETAFAVAFWGEVWRVLKPGGHVIAFSGTRTYHRLACAIEDAGFEIRDMVAWLYGSGFPKSHNQAAEWEGWGTALKPALEPVCLARKPLVATVERNLAAYGVGGMNIDACRVGEALRSRSTGEKISENLPMAGANYKREIVGEVTGRWPANVIHDGSPEVLAAFPNSNGGGAVSNRAAPKTRGIYGAFAGEEARFAGYADEGSAARFFYSAKADSEDRLGSDHPTVKPVDLMAWMVRLICPRGGTVLDPFAGSGTTGLAAMREGCDAILIEREPDHAEDIRQRMAWARGEGALTAELIGRRDIAKDTGAASGADLPLFGGGATSASDLEGAGQTGQFGRFVTDRVGRGAKR
jgi:site-specific DNA-methyltransferase (adenine-specific)